MRVSRVGELATLRMCLGTCEFHFPMVVGSQFNPGGPIAAPQVTPPELQGRVSPPESDTTRVPDASRINPLLLKLGYREGQDIPLSLKLDAGARRAGICVDFRLPLALAPLESVESGKKEERTMRRCFCVAIVALATGAASAQQEFKGMPWHLVDISWDTGEDLPFESYAIDVTIGADVPSSDNLYIAPR
jgi:hypothetical protein